MAAEIEGAANWRKPRELPDPDKIPDAMLREMDVTREQLKEIVARMKEREATTPEVGTLASDFELELLSPAGERTGERRRLSNHRGRPVALVFGSYT